MKILAIDIGTSKIAILYYDAGRPENSRSVSGDHHAAVTTEQGFAEQNPEQILNCVYSLLASFSKQELASMEGIALTGQMHSIVLWNDKKVSNIVSWQDHRASIKGTLERFRSDTALPLADGFGGTTLAYLSLEGTLSMWTTCADPADFLACKLTGNRQAMLDPTFAASWGIYDETAKQWNEKALQALKIPHAILPKIIPTGSVVGKTRSFPGLPDGIPVFCGIGDNQASVLGSAEYPEKDIFLTLGTGGQLSVVLTWDEVKQYSLPKEIEIRPFVGDLLLAVHAPLCGGKAWSWLGETVNRFLGALGLSELPEKELLDRLDAMAADETEGLICSPEFLGTRSDPTRSGKIEGITLSNLTLPNLAGALAHGILHSLISPFPEELLRRKQRLTGSGNGIRHCRSLRRAAEQLTNLPLNLCEAGEEAARGVALLVAERLRPCKDACPVKK